MKNSIRAALTAALLATTAAAVTAPAPVFAQAAAKPITVSADVGKKLNEANAKIAASDLDGALASVKEAQAVKNLTPGDTYQITRFLGIISVKKDDLVSAEQAFDALVRMPILPEAEKAQTLLSAAGLASANKNYDKVYEYVTMAEAANIKDSSLYVAAGNAAFMKNDPKAAESYAVKAVEVDKAAGKQSNRNVYDLMLQAQLQANNNAAAQTTMEQLAMNYGTSDDWGYAISGAIGTTGANDNTVVYLARLATATGAKVVDADAKMYGDSAFRAGLLGDAQKAQEKGAPVPPLFAAKLAQDKAAIRKAEAEAAKAKDGNVALANAQSFYGYGDYAKAEAAARDAIAKGGIKAPSDPNDAQMVLGQSLAAQGHYSEALPVFTAVKSSNAAINKAALLWAGYAQQKLKQVSAPPAAAR